MPYLANPSSRCARLPPWLLPAVRRWSGVALCGLGALTSLALWLMEWHGGIITRVDLLLQPVLMSALALTAWVGWRRPHLNPKATAACCALFALYLVASVHDALFFTGHGLNGYAVVTLSYWFALCYGAAFLFLSIRRAVCLSLATAVALFVPLAVAWWLQGAVAARWGPSAGMQLVNWAASHLVFLSAMAGVHALRIQQASAEARAQAMAHDAQTDPLTGLLNRRGVQDELMRLAQSRAALTVALIDVDHFKRINDQHGHPVGDQVLNRLASVLRKQLRTGDRIGRWGGEEFLVALPGATRADARALLERLREAVRRTAFAHGQPVSVSIGLAHHSPGEPPHHAVGRADAALYRAKRAGRDRVEDSEAAV